MKIQYFIENPGKFYVSYFLKWNGMYVKSCLKTHTPDPIPFPDGVTANKFRVFTVCLGSHASVNSTR